MSLYPAVFRQCLCYLKIRKQLLSSNNTPYPTNNRIGTSLHILWYFVVIILSLFNLSYACATDMNVVPQQRQIELENLLEQDCGSCHGSLLNGGLGPSLLPKALMGKATEFLKTTILNGRTDTAMPPWKPLLSEADVVWLIDRLLYPQHHKQEVEK